ncbi:hypothetical protein K439DRAFT_1353280 [Ramaria rubella]|nr:hypothetical protein K439DRAFT_1353280 [Ramaria rubella]
MSLPICSAPQPPSSSKCPGVLSRVFVLTVPSSLVASRPGRAVRLHCTVPTWSTSSDICTDLHDLQELRSRSLVFVHDLCRKLGSAGIQVSYRLAPSHTSMVLLRALPEDRVSVQEESDALEQASHGGRYALPMQQYSYIFTY